jgi:PAS domain S-box-containing protein
MSLTPPLRLLGVLSLMTGFGLAAVSLAPDGGHIGYMWPVGLASGALVLAPRRSVPAATVGIAILATTTFAVGDFPLAVAAGYGVGIAVEALVARRVLTVGWTPWLNLAEVNELGRYALTCALAALTGGLVFAGVAALNDYAVPWRIGIAAFTTHLASNAVLLALFREHRGPAPTSYGWTERLLAWGLTLGVAVIAFIPTEMPSAAFLVVPLLGWVAFRASTWEALSQLVAVAIITSTMTNEGLGPFSDSSLVARLDPEFRHLPQQSFLIACAMVTIPFAMAVAMQRRSAQEVVRERARSELLVQSARGIAIIGTDQIGRINLFSPGAQSILGYTPEEVYGQSTRMFHTEAELARHARELGSDPTYVSVVRATGELPPGTARVWQFVRKDGVPRTLSTILSPVTDDDDDFLGYVATADDITDRLDAEAALEKALATERRAVRRLTEIDQVKDAFVSSVSHELRTPITNIVGYLELMMDGIYGAPNEGQADAMSRIDVNSRRLLTLIDDLLTLSSMESIDQRRRRSRIDLVTVLRRADELIRPSTTQRELDLLLELPDEEVEVVGDSGELERLVINLGTNAVKFTPDGGRIVIRLLPSTSTAGPLLEVEDSGIGIPAEDQDKLFTRFFRSSRAHELGVPGSGLGLSIAQAIAEVHGAALSAESVHGTGSTFRVQFPLLPEPD